VIKKKKELVKKILAQNFSKKDKAKFYFTKGQKKWANFLIVKTFKKIEPQKIEQVKLSLRSELIDPTIELLQWIDTIGGLIPRNNIFKIPFFDTNNLLEHNPWRICPIGESWVKRHFRQKKNLEDVDGHCRKNPKGHDNLKGDEIDYIAQTQKLDRQKVFYK
jgi:hypothetical protein